MTFVRFPMARPSMAFEGFRHLMLMFRYEVHWNKKTPLFGKGNWK